MITLHAFANMFPGGIGETKDMRVQWALEEMGLPYQVRAWDYLGGECESAEFAAISPFKQLPLLEDDGMVIAETALILIHLAESYGRLTLSGSAGRTAVRQWSIAAMATVSPALGMIGLYDAGMLGADPAARNFLASIGGRWLDSLERQLEGRPWLMGEDFTIADILMAGVLREVRETELMDAYPTVRGFYARALARPAWSRTLDVYADRLGVDRQTLS